ncbi:MAG: LamG domain-containing protein, partial [Candidatus Sumerlaeota bacterium]
TQATELEIAGNIVRWSWGSGIFTLGGKGSGAVNDVPLIRYLVYQNQVDYTMLGCNDYGGIEHFQGGPFYVFNNITRNTVGTKTFTGTELGYNLYLDGGFKCYSFNNIIGGYQRPDDPSYYSHCGYFMVFGFMDQLFNNTIYRFEYALNGSSGNRSNILGNLMLDMSKTFIGQNRPGDVSMLGGGDTGEQGRRGIPTMSYASNVFFGEPKGGRNGFKFGYVGGNKGGDQKAAVYGGNSREELSNELDELGCRLATLGWKVDEMPLRDPDEQDYRLKDDARARDRGVKYFVPWSVGAMVGEWNFYRSDSNPELVLGEHFYMQPELRGRGMYYNVPRNDLTINQATADAYISGPLEDWIDGALSFDGNRFATLTHEAMHVDTAGFDGSKRKTPDMDTNNFMVEAFFKTESGARTMPIASKFNEKGYAFGIDADGRAVLILKDGNNNWSASSAASVNDGQWHHVLAEVDREAQNINIYVDGKLSAGQDGGQAFAPSVSISNTSDLFVGKETGSDNMFKGAIDFLRVARSTLADSNTSIEELYAWEFDGPQLKDFTGAVPVGKRDAGALELK